MKRLFAILSVATSVATMVISTHIFAADVSISLAKVSASELDDMGQSFTHFTAGAELAAKGNCDSAISEYLRAIQLNQENYRYYGWLGMCYYETRNPVLALLALEKAIALVPHYNKLYLWLARVERSLGNYDKSAAYDKLAKQYEPMQSSVEVFNYGMMSFYNGDFAEAKSYFSAAVIMFPKIKLYSDWYQKANNQMVK